MYVNPVTTTFTRQSVAIAFLRLRYRFGTPSIGSLRRAGSTGNWGRSVRAEGGIRRGENFCVAEFMCALLRNIQHGRLSNFPEYAALFA